MPESMFKKNSALHQDTFTLLYKDIFIQRKLIKLKYYILVIVILLLSDLVLRVMANGAGPGSNPSLLHPADFSLVQIPGME
jgi:hypothetical protein